MKIQKILILPYEQNLVLVASSDCEKLSKFTKKNDCRNTEFSYVNHSGASFTDGADSYYIALRTDIKLTVGVIAHECMLTLNALYQDLGIKLDTDNDENECYLLGWMVDEVWGFYKEQLNKKK